MREATPHLGGLALYAISWCMLTATDWLHVIVLLVGSVSLVLATVCGYTGSRSAPSRSSWLLGLPATHVSSTKAKRRSKSRM